MAKSLQKICEEAFRRDGEKNVIIVYVQFLDDMIDFLILFCLVSKQILQTLLLSFLSAYDLIFQTQVPFYVPHTIWWGVSSTRFQVTKEFLSQLLFSL